MVEVVCFLFSCLCVCGMHVYVFVCAHACGCVSVGAYGGRWLTSGIFLDYSPVYLMVSFFILFRFFEIGFLCSTTTRPMVYLLTGSHAEPGAHQFQLACLPTLSWRSSVSTSPVVRLLWATMPVRCLHGFCGSGLGSSHFHSKSFAR